MAGLTGVMVGNYFLLECLGREGMIESYRARPTTRGGFDVVLRLFRPPFPDPSAFQEHFVSEVEKVWHCHHENIQPLLEYGLGEDLLFDVTDFPKYKTLNHFLARGEDGEFLKSLEYIGHLITQLCDALEYAHTQNIVHGNIQPSSLLIQPDQTIVLTNFSMKRIYHAGDQLVAQIEEGNASYIAPEQVLGMLAPASDIYAVGVLLFHLLTGYLPYDGESAGEIALKHANEAIPSLRQLRLDLPESVELVVRVALSKSPEARFPSANALAQAFIAAIATDTPPIITARPERRIEVHSRRKNSFVWSSVLSFIAIMVVIAGLIGVLNFFSTLPMYLQDNSSIPLHAPTSGSVVETRHGTTAGANLAPTTTSNEVTPSTLIPTSNKNNSTPQAHTKPVVRRTNSPAASGTVIPIIPLTHNLFCVSGTITLDSSQNLEPLLQNVDTDYLKTCQETTISLSGDGSRTSINKLERGRIDIAGSDLTANPGRNLTDHPIGAMLYALIVSPDVALNSLRKTDLQDIFDGSISNWAQVGGSNEAITVVLPPAESSINEIFQSYILNEVNEHCDAMRLNRDFPAMVVQSILHTPGAISFVPLFIAQETGMKILAIDGVEPGAQSLLDGTYAFWSVEHFYMQNDGLETVQAYEQFLNSYQEQQVLQEFGIVPMNMLDQSVVDTHGSGPEL